MQTDVQTTEQIEQYMQTENSVRDESLQTSNQEDVKEEQPVAAVEFMPQVVDKLMSDIVNVMPVAVKTETQQTSTENIQTTEQDTQTTPPNDVPSAPSVENVEPYEIHIETSFVIPEEMQRTSHGEDGPVTIEIEKTFVIDDEQSGLMREIASEQKVKKSKSKKKKKNKSADKPSDSEKPEELPKQSEEIAVMESEKKSQPEQKPTLVTLNITKTSVYDTTNVISKERRTHPSVTIEEVMSDDNTEVPLSPGKLFHTTQSIADKQYCSKVLEQTNIWGYMLYCSNTFKQYCTFCRIFFVF